MTAIVTVTLNPALDAGLSVERMTPGDKLRSGPPTLEPGGGGINVARALARLGGLARALWLCGGAEGQRLATLLDGEALSHEAFPCAAETRRNLHIEARATGELFRITVRGDAVTAAELATLAHRVESLDDITWLVLSGSLPPGLPTDTWACLADRAAEGTRVILDSSGEALRAGLRGRVFLVKPNARELEQLAGRELKTRAGRVAAARALIAAGRVEVVAVSLGSAGLLLVTHDDDIDIAAPTVEAVSAVGAGDSTVAGIVHGLAQGRSLEEALRYGAAAGAAAVLTPGTGLCRREDTERLFADLHGGG